MGELVQVGGMRLGELQALPQDAEPVTKWDDPDTALCNVAEGILTRIQQPSSLAVPKHICNVIPCIHQQLFWEIKQHCCLLQ